MSAKIAAALHEVMSKVSYVQKTGYNSFHKYKFAGESDLLAVLRPALVEAGLLLIPSLEEIRDIDNFGNTTVVMNYTLVHKDGDVWPLPIRVPGTGNDANSKGGVGDKGTYKAMTGANKYLLFKLFQIETGDEPEGDHESQAPLERKPPPRKPDVTRDRHFGNAAEEIRSGQNGTPASARKAVTVQSDPAAWVASEDGKGFMREARADLTMVRTFEELKKWEHANRAKLDAFDEHGGALTLKDGRTYKAFMDDLMADAYDAIKASAGNLRAAG